MRMHRLHNTEDDDMLSNLQRSDRRAALRAWDAAVESTRTYSALDSESYSRALVALDNTWRDAALPLPWYPSMVARGMSELRS